MIKNIIKEYTKIKPCAVEGSPDAHTVWFVVGKQSFCVTSPACETKKDAEWTQEMLAKAIIKLLENEKA